MSCVPNEQFEITVVPGAPIPANTQFTLEIKPTVGAALSIVKSTPASNPDSEHTRLTFPFLKDLQRLLDKRSLLTGFSRFDITTFALNRIEKDSR